MILSRAIARRRIATGVRPGWFGAWGLVAFDAAALLMVFAVMLPPLFSNVTMPVWLTIIVLFAVVFVPMQAVLIVSSLWAAKSRWRDPALDATPRS